MPQGFLLVLPIASLVIIFGFSPAYTAQDSDSSRVPYSEIVKALHSKMLADYKKVPYGINCKKDKYVAARIVCTDKYLRLVELLYNRSSAYSVENLGAEIKNHSKFHAEQSDSDDLRRFKECQDKSCVYEFFKNEINNSMGGFSPFAKPVN